MLKCYLFSLTNVQQVVKSHIKALAGLVQVRIKGFVLFVCLGGGYERGIVSSIKGTAIFCGATLKHIKWFTSGKLKCCINIETSTVCVITPDRK